MQDTTNILRRAFGAITLSGALALAAGCHSTPAGPDPAQANLAPANGQTQVLGQNVSYSPQQQSESYPQQAPAPVEQAYPQQSGGYYPTDTEAAGEEALAETTQAPPPLPEYDQPPAPGPDYIWTPGYWAWGPYGYYWVPGAWVEAPYYGALWTPPYWGWYGGYYHFHPGYWGRHIGYYGGIDYGFGYIGIGYFGGYWSGDHFYYNRAVTRVSPEVRTVYERPVVYNNVRYGGQPANRVSYNGGRGGINVQPRPSEIAAMHERHDVAMPIQRQARVEASQNRAQSFTVNHGRPSQAFVQHGFANTRGIAPAPRAAEPAGPVPEGRYAQPNAPNAGYVNAPHGQPYAGEPRGENRAMQLQPNGGNPRFENRSQPQPQPNVNSRFENRPQPQPQPNAANPRFENRPQPQPQPNATNPRVENRPQPQPQPRVENRAMQPQPNAGIPRYEHQPSRQPEPRAENRPQPQPQPQPRMEAPRAENRAMPQPQPQPRMEAPRAENRPMPQQQHMEAPRVENRPAPQPRPQGPPPQQARPAPPPQQPHGGGGGNGGHQGGDHGGDHGHR